MKAIALIVALALSACASERREPPAPPDPCQVEPQPLSCAGADDARSARVR